MDIDEKTKISVLEDDWWEGLSTTDTCSVVKIKEHSVLITNGIVRREIPKTMLGDFMVVSE